MAISNQIPTITFSKAMSTVKACVDANLAVLLLGDPGVGKTSVARMVAQAIGKDLATMIGATTDPVDVAGVPFLRVDGKGVDRFPLSIIQDACDKPVLLFLDEISAAPPAVQAAFLRLILERVAGDRQLHPDTRVIAAANPPEQAPGGFELSAPLMGRVVVFKFRPTHHEILDFMSTLGSDAEDADDLSKALRLEAEDFALTAGAQPDLLQIDIPSECITGGTPWAAPRNWEHALRGRAAARVNKAGDTVTSLITEGAVGRTIATSYEGILKLRNVLPTVEEIVADPAKAKLPANAKEQIAVLGVMAHVANQNSWAAWIYAGRLEKPEYRQACAKILQKKIPSAMTAPHAKEGVKARVNLLGSLPRLSQH